MTILDAEVVIVPAIVLAIFTGHDIIYSAREYSSGADGKTWLHVGAHLGLGTAIVPLVGWLVECLILFVTRKRVTRSKDATAVANGASTQYCGVAVEATRFDYAHCEFRSQPSEQILLTDSSTGKSTWENKP